MSFSCMPLRRPLLALVVSVAAWASMLGSDALAPAPAQPRAAAAAPSTPPVYISLGDSLAAGWQPDRQGNDRATKQGYVDVVARSLARSHPGLQIQRMSCGGATSGTLLSGGAGCQPRGERSQLERAEETLKANPNTVLVTVNIGDNDVEMCIDGNTGAVDAACMQRGEATVDRTLPQIAARLRAAASPSTRIIGLVDYDQFLSLWLDGAKGRAAARRSLGIIGKLNQRITQIYQQAGIEVADAGGRFATQDLTHTRWLHGYGRVPLAVYNICTLTWACSAEPIGHDDHARPAGYRQIALAILDVLHGKR
jgi:lysophospholipase L1-like esterase